MRRPPLVQLCLSHGAIDGALLTRLIADYDLGFDPERLYCEPFAPNGEQFRPNVLSRLASVPGPLASAGVEGAEGGEFDLGRFRGFGEQLIWRPERLPVDRSLIEAVIRLPGFKAGYWSDAEDVQWQSEESIQVYERAGRPHSHLPRTEGVLPMDREIIDISINPGRRTPLDGIWLFAAAEMWFGAGAFRYLDRDRLLRLPVGGVAERPGRIVHVELFPYEWYTENIEGVRERQRQFREWMRLDDLEARADELDDADVDMDPSMEIEEGQFPHGGVRRITEWYASDGLRSMPKSHASIRRVFELSQRGELVWRDESRVSDDAERSR